MKDNSLVSIIIPVYQAVQYLDDCLITVTQQTYNNLEIILVDDGSTDGSSLLCNVWSKKDKRIKVIHKKNGGRSEARNVGLSEAKGSYILFIDSDDWVANTMIEKLVNSLERANADMAVCQFTNVFPNGKRKENTISGKGTQILNRREFFSLLLKDDMITNHLWRMLFKRKIISKVSFPKGKDFEDIYTMPELVSDCRKIICIDDVEYFYRHNKNSAVHSISINKYRDHYMAIIHSYCRIIEFEPSLKSEADTMLIQKSVGILKEIYDNEKKIAVDDRKEKLIKNIKSNIKESAAIKDLGKRDRVFYYLLLNLPTISRIYFKLIGSDHSTLMKLKERWKRCNIYGKE